MTGPGTTDQRESGHAATAGTVRVQYWAAARSAAGVGHDDVPVHGDVSLAELREAALARRGDDDRLRRVLDVCSVLVGDRPAGAGDPAEVLVRPGEQVQFLPPFAGG
ncbi:hypothetical protein GCM10009737_16440 [Nocardioides lentus]|uniref:MoaD/ThiS family protein n=1 Tax=Nocardioides lentus TaxID=338077 RepID=A0ABP5AJF1_9ACTN